MTTLFDIILQAGLGNKVLNDRQLARLVNGTDARRYGLVNRALREGSLIRIKRGLYVASDVFNQILPHRFVVAQAIRPCSYVSFETALSNAGWIPESTFLTSSVVSETKSIEFNSDVFGTFEYRPLAIQMYGFLIGVKRHEMQRGTALIATPMRALMDLVALRKQEWAGLDWLTQGLRIDADYLTRLDLKEVRDLRSVYKQKRPHRFLLELEAALKIIQSPTERSGNSAEPT
jgi:hypothetical protein